MIKTTIHTFREIKEGSHFEHIYQITPAVYEGFLKTFKDYSPIHCDDNYAKLVGFQEKVMHGAILNGFLSHFLGMVMPGKKAMLLTSDMRYTSPCKLNDEVRFQVSVIRKVAATQTLLLSLSVMRVSAKEVVSRGKIQVKVRDE
jgi:3-hydroxybutyryl-CoA dehydratase